MSEAVRLRAALKSSDRVAADVTYTHLLIKAVAVALEGHPRLNASYVEEGREYKADVNIGLAVALEDGLIVPVLHHCNKLSLLDIAAQANALVERAWQRVTAFFEGLGFGAVELDPRGYRRGSLLVLEQS